MRGVITNPSLTADRLRELLHYDPETGVFTRLVGRSGRNSRAGSVAGSLSADGYRHIWMDGRIHLSHRLAWLYQTGAWPDCEVDHINLARGDNRWLNLRLASHGQNQANSGPYRTNKCGLKGVYARKHRWIAAIRHEGKTRHLGVFDTKEAAHAAYVAAALELHGNFARAA